MKNSSKAQTQPGILVLKPEPHYIPIEYTYEQFVREIEEGLEQEHEQWLQSIMAKAKEEYEKRTQKTTDDLTEEEKPKN